MIDLIGTLQYQRGVLEGLPDQKKTLSDRRHIADRRAQLAEVAATEVGLAREFYKRAIDLVYETKVGELEKVVNLALAYVFESEKYVASFKTDEARGVKTLNIMLKDNTKEIPVEVNMKDGIGAGVRTLVSVVLQVYYLINKGAFPILFVDEGWSQVSEDYLERFFSFLRGLCEKKGFRFVLISHDPRLLNYADKRYRVTNGNVKEETT